MDTGSESRRALLRRPRVGAGGPGPMGVEDGGRNGQGQSSLVRRSSTGFPGGGGDRAHSSTGSETKPDWGRRRRRRRLQRRKARHAAAVQAFGLYAVAQFTRLHPSPPPPAPPVGFCPLRLVSRCGPCVRVPEEAPGPRPG